jgi:hypothetical protein
MHKIIFGCSKADLVSSGLFATIEYDGQLSATAYIILAVVLLGIITGLGWCFYRAVTKAGSPDEPQSHDEVGDEQQRT